MNHLGLFAKYWEPGKVKTRLARDLGPLCASKIYLTFLRHLLAGMSEFGDVRTVGYSPPDKRDQFAIEVGSAWGLTPQFDGDLGARMETFFVWAHQENRLVAAGEQSSVVLIGSDTPHLPAALIGQAFAWLQEKAVVLGPSTDGGYFLIGMSERSYPIFENVAWSTESVLDQTIAHLDQQGLDYELLEPMTDIDHLEDLTCLSERLKNEPQKFAPRDQELLVAIEKIAFAGSDS